MPGTSPGSGDVEGKVPAPTFKGLSLAEVGVSPHKQETPAWGETEKEGLVQVLGLWKRRLPRLKTKDGGMVTGRRGGLA